MNDKDFFITGGAGMNKELTGYSHLFFTDMTTKMNKLYSIDEIIINSYWAGQCPLDAYLESTPVPRTVDTVKKLRGARIMHLARNHEANAVMYHFLEMTFKLGQFAAVLYAEVAKASNLSQNQVNYATKESFFRMSEIDGLDGNNRVIMEFNTNLFPIMAELPKIKYSKQYFCNLHM